MMRKKDKLLKKRSKMDIKKCERKYRKEVQRAIANGTPITYSNLGILYVDLSSKVQLAVAILESIAGSYRNEK